MSVLLTSFVASFICSGSVAAAGAFILSRRNRTKDDDFGVVSIKHKEKEIARIEREKNERYKQEIKERLQLAIDYNLKTRADQREKIEKERIALKRSHLYPEWKSEESSLRRDPSNKKNIRKKKTEKKTDKKTARTSAVDVHKEVKKIIEESSPRSRAERLAREFKDFQEGTQRSINKYDEFYDRLDKNFEHSIDSIDEYGFYDWRRP